MTLAFDASHAPQLLRDAFDAAVAAADPTRIVAAHLPAVPAGRTLVLGAGKAAASMAHAVEQHWPANAALSGLVVTRYAHGLPLSRIRCVEAGHPVPDAAGESAARDMLDLATELGEDDLLIVLVSGGGPACCPCPLPPYRSKTFVWSPSNCWPAAHPSKP